MLFAANMSYLHAFLCERAFQMSCKMCERCTRKGLGMLVLLIWEKAEHIEVFRYAVRSLFAIESNTF